MKLIDLHIHSTASDGTLSPTEIALYAKKKGLNAIALTDHDTVAGIAECVKTGLQIGLIVVPGIELSADYYGTEFHILGYYIDSDCAALNEALKGIVENRTQRNLKILEKLNALGLSLTLEELRGTCEAHTILTRAHFASALLNKGYVSTKQEAFSKYLGKDKPAYVPRTYLTVKDCIQLIHEAGGLAVLAHPMLYGYSPSEITQILKVLAKDGLDGVECLYSTHTKYEVTHLLQVCLNERLFPTGGSDFHGENKPCLDIGTGHGTLEIPFEILEAMRKRLGKIC